MVGYRILTSFSTPSSEALRNPNVKKTRYPLHKNFTRELVNKYLQVSWDTWVTENGHFTIQTCLGSCGLIRLLDSLV